uniref:Uncharacterized protein n=1 Tax=Arundo donax TaxID=35708 RepID=A0A0A9E4I6_ARUDO
MAQGRRGGLTLMASQTARASSPESARRVLSRIGEMEWARPRGCPDAMRRDGGATGSKRREGSATAWRPCDGGGGVLSRRGPRVNPIGVNGGGRSLTSGRWCEDGERQRTPWMGAFRGGGGESSRLED